MSGGASSTTMRMARYVDPQTTYTMTSAIRTRPNAGATFVVVVGRSARCVVVMTNASC